MNMRCRSSWLLVGVFVVACGGDSPTAPTSISPFLLTITLPRQVHGAINDDGDYQCNYTVTAAAVGGETGTFAYWNNVTLDWSRSDGAKFTHLLFESDLTDWFGSDRVVSGRTQTANRRSRWSDAYDITFQFRYRVCPPGTTGSSCRGEERTNTLFFSCT